MSTCHDREPYTADTLDAEAMRVRLRDMAGRGRPGGPLRVAADLWAAHGWWARRALRDDPPECSDLAAADAWLEAAGIDVTPPGLPGRLADLAPGETLTDVVEGEGGQLRMVAWRNDLAW